MAHVSLIYSKLCTDAVGTFLQRLLSYAMIGGVPAVSRTGAYAVGNAYAQVAVVDGQRYVYACMVAVFHGIGCRLLYDAVYLVSHLLRQTAPIERSVDIERNVATAVTADGGYIRAHHCVECERRETWRHKLVRQLAHVAPNASRYCSA